MKSLSVEQASEEAFGGFAVLDDKGRVSLPVHVRRALGVQPGSYVSYLVINGQLLLIPQDRELAELMERAAEAYADLDLTSEDIQKIVDEARGEVARAAYGAEFIEKLDQYRKDHQ